MADSEIPAEAEQQKSADVPECPTCDAFEPQAWRKSLCRNCFHALEEHAEDLMAIEARAIARETASSTETRGRGRKASTPAPEGPKTAPKPDMKGKTRIGAKDLGGKDSKDALKSPSASSSSPAAPKSAREKILEKMGKGSERDTDAESKSSVSSRSGKRLSDVEDKSSASSLSLSKSRLQPSSTASSSPSSSSSPKSSKSVPSSTSSTTSTTSSVGAKASKLKETTSLMESKLASAKPGNVPPKSQEVRIPGASSGSSLSSKMSAFTEKASTNGAKKSTDPKLSSKSSSDTPRLPFGKSNSLKPKDSDKSESASSSFSKGSKTSAPFGKDSLNKVSNSKSPSSLALKSTKNETNTSANKTPGDTSGKSDNGSKTPLKDKSGVSASLTNSSKEKEEKKRSVVLKSSAGTGKSALANVAQSGSEASVADAPGICAGDDVRGNLSKPDTQASIGAGGGDGGALRGTETSLKGRQVTDSVNVTSEFQPQTPSDEKQAPTSDSSSKSVLGAEQRVGTEEEEGGKGQVNSASAGIARKDGSSEAVRETKTIGGQAVGKDNIGTVEASTEPDQLDPGRPSKPDSNTYSTPGAERGDIKKPTQLSLETLSAGGRRDSSGSGKSTPSPLGTPSKSFLDTKSKFRDKESKSPASSPCLEGVSPTKSFGSLRNGSAEDLSSNSSREERGKVSASESETKLKEELKQREDEVAALNKRLAEMEERVTQLEKEKTSAQEDEEKRKKELTQAEEKAKEEREERSKQDQAAGSHKKDMDTMRAKLSELQTKLDEKETQCERLTTDNHGLKERLKTCSDKKTEDESDKANTKTDGSGAEKDKELALLEQDLEAAERELEETREDNRELRRQVMEMRNEMDEMTDSFRESEHEEFREMQRELEMASKNCRILQFKLRKSERRNMQTEEDRASYEDKLRQLEAQFDSRDARSHIQVLEEELRVAKEVSVRLHDELDIVEDKRLKAMEENRHLTELLEHTDKRQFRMEMEIDKLRDMVCDLKQQLKEAHAGEGTRNNQDSSSDMKVISSIYTRSID